MSRPLKNHHNFKTTTPPRNRKTNHPRQKAMATDPVVEPAHTSLESKKRVSIVLALSLAMLTLAVYWPVCHVDFPLSGDDLPLTLHPHIAKGLSADGLYWAWTSTEGSNWQPLTRLSLMLDAQLHGQHASGFRLTNLRLHSANVVLLFAALRCDD